jgi:hypothetical protein
MGVEQKLVLGSVTGAAVSGVTFGASKRIERKADAFLSVFMY